MIRFIKYLIGKIQFKFSLRKSIITPSGLALLNYCKAIMSNNDFERIQRYEDYLKDISKKCNISYLEAVHFVHDTLEKVKANGVSYDNVA